jgi:simple sugar transport system permease protein
MTAPATPSVIAPVAAGRRGTAIAEALLPPVVALLIALVAGDLLILAFGQSPAAVFGLLLEGTWGNAYGFGQVLYKATTLICTGLAVALGLRAGLFNIGAEGQLAAGAFAAALAGLWLPAGFSALLAVPIAIAAALAAGGATGWVPGVLKARFGAHEVRPKKRSTHSSCRAPSGGSAGAPWSLLSWAWFCLPSTTCMCRVSASDRPRIFQPVMA